MSIILIQRDLCVVRMPTKKQIPHAIFLLKRRRYLTLENLGFLWFETLWSRSCMILFRFLFSVRILRAKKNRRSISCTCLVTRCNVTLTDHVGKEKRKKIYLNDMKGTMILLWVDLFKMTKDKILFFSDFLFRDKLCLSVCFI